MTPALWFFAGMATMLAWVWLARTWRLYREARPRTAMEQILRDRAELAKREAEFEASVLRLIARTAP